MSKAHERLEACGDVDELNAGLGALGASLADEDPNVAREIQEIQSTLFHIGAWLATTSGSPFTNSLKPIDDKQIKSLETAIDRMDGEARSWASNDRLIDGFLCVLYNPALLVFGNSPFISSRESPAHP